MADLVRQMTVKRGYDPREFSVFLFRPRWSAWAAAGLAYSHGGRAEASAARCCGAATPMRRSARSR